MEQVCRGTDLHSCLEIINNYGGNIESKLWSILPWHSHRNIEAHLLLDRLGHLTVVSCELLSSLLSSTRQDHLTTLLPRNLLASGLGNILARRGRGGRCRLRRVARSWGRCLSIVVGLEGGGPQLLEHPTHPLEAGRPVGRPLRPRLLLVQVLSIGGGPSAGQARGRRLQVLGRPPRLVTAVPPPSLGGDQRLVVLQQVVVLLPQVLVVSGPEQGGLGDDWWVGFGSNACHGDHD